MKICSACLLGVNCRYDGKSRINEKVIALSKEVLIPVCPEQFGGLATPRLSAEIKGGDGLSVLNKKARVIETSGADVSNNFIKGAEEVLKIAKLYNANEAILKQNSPSCGCGKIYDGTFSGIIKKGDGVTTSLLKKNKIKVISEEDL